MRPVSIRPVQLIDRKTAGRLERDRAVMRAIAREAGGGALASLVARIRSLDIVGWQRQQTSGRPDPRALARFAVDLDATPLRRRHEAPAPRIVLGCLVDSSSSMGLDATRCEGCALALVDAVRRAGGLGAIGTWTHYALHWTEPIAAARLITEGGGTPLPEGIANLGRALRDGARLAGPRARRLAIVLCDGLADQAESRAAVRRLQSEGVAVLGVYLAGGSEGGVAEAAAIAEVRAARGLAPNANIDRWSTRTAGEVAAARERIEARMQASPEARAHYAAPWRRQTGAQLAECLGAPAVAITTPQELAPALAPALWAVLNGGGGQTGGGACGQT